MRVIIFFLVMCCASSVFSQKKNSNAWIKEQTGKSKASPEPSKEQSTKRTNKPTLTIDPDNTAEKGSPIKEEGNQNQESEKGLPAGFFSNWSMGIECGVLPTKSKGSNDILSPIGQLEMAYNFGGKVRLSLIGQTMFYHQNNDLASIDGKIMDLSSTEYNSIGLGLGYLLRFGKLEIMPKIDVLYNMFLAKAIDYNTTNSKNFIDNRYVSLNPKLYFGFRLNNSLTVGLNGGFNNQIIALKGQKYQSFDPNGINGSLFFHFNFRK
jgi:hypothetical protein